MKKLLFVLLSIFSLNYSSFSQNQVVGTVTNNNDLPISDVLVLVKGTEIRTSTDNSGKYSIEIPQNYNTLTFQKQGFLVKEVEIRNKEVNVVMTSEALNIFELSLEELMEIRVVTASKKAEKAEEAPANIYVITSEQIRNRAYRNLFELLNDLPGMTNTTQLGEMFAGTPSVRGLFQTKRLKLMVNGLTIDPREGSGTGWTDRFPLEGVERVEFIAGPYATTYGRNTFSGVINIILKQATNIVNAETSLMYGTYNQIQASNAVMAKTEQWQMYFSMFYNYSKEGVDLVKEYPEYYSLDARLNSTLFGKPVELAPNATDKFILPWKHTDVFFSLKHNSGLGLDLSVNSSEHAKVAPQFTPLFYASNKEAIIHDEVINTRVFFDTEINKKLNSYTAFIFQNYDWWGKIFMPTEPRVNIHEIILLTLLHRTSNTNP